MTIRNDHLVRILRDSITDHLCRDGRKGNANKLPYSYWWVPNVLVKPPKCDRFTKREGNAASRQSKRHDGAESGTTGMLPG